MSRAFALVATTMALAAPPAVAAVPLNGNWHNDDGRLHFRVSRCVHNRPIICITHVVYTDANGGQHPVMMRGHINVVDGHATLRHSQSPLVTSVAFSFSQPYYGRAGVAFSDGGHLDLRLTHSR